MNSSQLSNAISGNLQVIDTALNISPTQIFKAATEAQKDVLMDSRATERIGTIALQSGITEYKFEELSIENATNATPIVITITGHPFDTGDTVNIFGVLGNTATNGRWVITKIGANTFSLDDSVGNGAYTSGGKLYHDLMSVFELKSMFMKDSPYGPIEILDPMSVEEAKISYSTSISTGSEIDSVPKLYQVYEEDGMRLVLIGAPTSTIVAKMFYTRVPTAGEEITATKNPIIPDVIRSAFIHRTMWHLLTFYTNSEKAKVKAREYDKDYDKSLFTAKRRNSQRRYQRNTDPPIMNWK